LTVRPRRPPPATALLSPLAPGTDPRVTNRHFQRLGLPPAVCDALVNPGFHDPFDVDADITLDNPAYRWGPGLWSCRLRGADRGLVRTAGWKL
jgi:hypothetical protein